MDHSSLARPDRNPVPVPPPSSDESAALFARALDLQRAGEIAAAVALYEEILALTPDLAEAHNNLGVGLAKLGRLAEAQAAYHRAIALKADYPQACFNLAIALAAMRRFGEAEPMYRRAIALKPDFPAAYRNLGITLVGLGRHADAAAACRVAIGLDPNDWEAHVTLGTALKSLGQPGDAEVVLRRSLALNPSNAEAHSSLGTVLQDLGKAAAAEASFRQAIAIRPDYAGAYNNLGLVLKESGRFDEAHEAAQRAVALAPRRLSFYGNLAEVRRFTAGDAVFVKLEEMARESSSLAAEERVHLHFALAKAYGDIGQHENAFRQWLAGNAQKRRNVIYDEAALLAGLRRVQEIFSPALLRGLEGLGETSRVPIFIVGMARSGTTLIEQILASHPAVHGGGELRLFDRAAATIRSLMPGAPEYPDMVLSMDGAHVRALGTRYVRELVVSAPDATHITDKMPSNFAFAGLIHLALPNAIIIHAVRDPLDTCVSCFSKHFIDGQLHTYDLAELGRYFRHYRALMAHWHRVLPPGRILDVSYEDMVAELEAAARRIIAHCGLPWDKRCLDFHLTERTVRTASATQVRNPIYKGAVGRWRRYEYFLAPLVKELQAEDPHRGSAGC